MTFAKLAGSAARTLGLAVVLALSPAALGAGTEVALRADSPQRYTVVEGDTLWDIAGKFLEEPWLWPEVWQINPQIENPDLIYPGDEIELAFVDGSPVLRLSRSEAPELRTVRLSPQVRRESLLSPVPAIPLELISAYLIEDSVVSEDDFERAPYVLAEREGRTLLSEGDEILARGRWSEGVAVYDIVRKGRDLENPDTGALLGLEAVQVGVATLSRSDDDQATLTITHNVQEVRVGDRLIPRDDTTLDTRLLPAPPPFAVDAAIVSIGSGRSIGGQYETLILNAGADDRIAVGQLLTVQEPALELEDRLGSRSPFRKFKQILGVDDSDEVVFSGENVASVLVYKVFDDASLGLVLESSREIRLTDRVVTP
jgi:hypothetical protein